MAEGNEKIELSAGYMFKGRPRMFKNVEEFEDRAEQYFISNEGKKISWTGLCLAVGASSRQSMQPYRNGEHDEECKPEHTYSDSIKVALSMVESYYEENGTGHAGKDIFIMKNFDWKDTQTQTLVHETGKVSGKAGELLDNLSEDEG